MKLDILWTDTDLYAHSSYFETWISIVGVGEIKLSAAKSITQDFWVIYITYDSSDNYESYIFGIVLSEQNQLLNKKLNKKLLIFLMKNLMSLKIKL